MARLILDTAVLVAVERGLLSVDRVASRGDEVAISAVTAAELLEGVEMAGPRQRRARLERVERTLARTPVLDYDLATAREHARLLAHCRRTGHPRGAHDLMIAATAAAHGRTIVTTDQRGFEGLPGVSLRGPVR